MVSRKDVEVGKSRQTHIYREVENSIIRADIFPPLKDVKTNDGTDIGNPILLFIHGGGWMASNRGDVSAPFIAKARDFGFAIVSMDYRLAPETQLDGMLDNLKYMGGWLRSVLPGKLPGKVDTNKIVVVGASAGALLGLSAPKVWGNYQPCAIVSLYGPSDMRDLEFITDKGDRLLNMTNQKLKKGPSKHRPSSQGSGSSGSSGSFIPPSSEVIEKGTNYDQPPSQTNGYHNDPAFTTARGSFSAYALNKALLAEITNRGLRGVKGNRDFPAKTKDDEIDEYYKISPIYLATVYQFPPTYIVRCKNDNVFRPRHAEKLREILTKGPLPVKYCPKIADMRGMGGQDMHACDNTFTELAPVQAEVPEWMKKVVGI